MSSKRRQGEGFSESDELPADARVLENAACIQEEDAQERGFLSWRMKDADGILLLCSAVKRLCARTVSQEDIELGKQDLIAYMRLCVQVSPSFILPNLHFKHLFHECSCGEPNAFGPTIILLRTSQSRSSDMDQCIKYGPIQASDSIFCLKTPIATGTVRDSVKQHIWLHFIDAEIVLLG